MGIFKEFKAFAIKGNVVDLAVGVVIGAAFGKIVNSMVKDLVNPLLGIITDDIDFGDKVLVLRRATEDMGAVTLSYGMFLNTLLEFLIISFVIFLVVRQINRWKRSEPAPEPSTYECPFCFTVISRKAKRCPHCTSELNPTDV